MIMKVVVKDLFEFDLNYINDIIRLHLVSEDFGQMTLYENGMTQI